MRALVVPEHWLGLLSQPTTPNLEPAHQAFRDGGRVEPTDAQKEAGNYRKERATFQGLPISIETKKGQSRSGVGADGKPWSVKMPADYGYVRRTEGADGDHVDCYLGPDGNAPRAWIIDQVDPKTRVFDEHKLMLGFRNRGHAESTYRAGFSDGKGGRRIGAVTEISMPDLKEWLADRQATVKPALDLTAGYREAFASGGAVSDPWSEFPLAPAPAQAAPEAAASNPFDQFDAPAQPAANPFDQFDEKPRATFDERFGNGPMARVPEKPGVVEDVAKTAPAALARGTAGLLGIPGLISHGADWLANQSAGRVESLVRGKGFVAPTPEEQAARTKEVEALQSQTSAGQIGQMIDLGRVLTPERITAAIESATGPLYKPQTDTGRYVGAVGEMAPGAVLGGGTLLQRVLSTIGAGLGSEGLHDATRGTWFEPYARFIGGIGGGVAGASAPAAASSAASAVRSGARALTDPLTRSGRERLAARQLEERATDPKAMREALEQPGDLVPGSVPTTFQKTGDMGIGALEREVATLDPVAFNARRAEQNAARVAAMRELQPEGSAVDVASSLRTQLRDLDDAAAAIEARYAGEARRAVDDIGGTRQVDDLGRDIQAAVEPQRQALVRGAQESAATIAGRETPEVYGAATRAALEDARAAAKAQERSLWNAVDPDGSLTLDITPLRSAARDIEAALGRSAKPIAGEERAIFDVVGSYQPVIPFRELTDLRSRLSTAMREEMRASGQTPVYARLANLRGSLESTIDSAVERRVAQEAEAVATGAMRAEDTMAAALANWSRQRDDWLAARAEAIGTATAAGSRAHGSGGASFVPGAPGSKGQGGSRFSDTAGRQGLPPDVPLAPNLDDAAAERLRAASAATRERARTFDAGPVGETLKTRGMAGDFRVSDASAAAKFFRPGPQGAEAVQAFRRAVGDDAAALQSLQEFAQMSLRRAAMRPDGTLDPARYQRWLGSHRDAMREFPELRARFDTAESAADTLDRFRPYRADLPAGALPGQYFQPGPAGSERVSELRRLIGEERANAILSDYAAAQLRRSAVAADGAIDPAKFAQWQAQHAPALRAMPEVEAKFADAARASRMVAEAAADRKQALNAAQVGAAGKLLGMTDPDDVVRTVGAIFGQKDGVRQMRELASRVRHDEQAMNGLRRAVADHIDRKFLSNTEAATSSTDLISANAFQTFVRQNRATLGQVFDQKEVQILDAIAADLKRANRSITTVKLPGQSNTAQDMLAQVGKGGESMLSRIIKLKQAESAGAGAAAGWLIGGIPGAAVGAGMGWVNAARNAGMQKVNDIVKEALLDPALARALLQKAPIKPGRGSDITLQKQLGRLSVFGAEGAASERQKPE